MKIKIVDKIPVVEPIIHRDDTREEISQYSGITSEVFIDGFLSRMILLDQDTIYPDSNRDKRGFQSLTDIIETESLRLKSENLQYQSKLLWSYRRLSNFFIEKHSTGNYVNIEKEIYKKKYINNDGTSIRINMNIIQAGQVFNSIPEYHKEIIIKATNAFLRARLIFPTDGVVSMADLHNSKDPYNENSQQFLKLLKDLGQSQYWSLDFMLALQNYIDGEVKKNVKRELALKFTDER